MQIRFEQTHIQQVLRQLAQACDGRFIEAVALDKTKGLTEALQGNPVGCLDEAGLSSWDYKGEYASPSVLPKGSWGFDTDIGFLVYRLQFADRVVNLNPRANELHFKLRTEFADVTKDSEQVTGERITGLLIESVHNYRWRTSADD